tara:strand:+ start:322 stop:513 length:192 start_codon:yes stop_codon:yes gene_type:complete
MVENPNNAGMKALTDSVLKGCPPNCNRTIKQKRKSHKKDLSRCGKKTKGCKVVKVKNKRRRNR